MHPLSVLLTGAPIEDAFVYRTHLYCWTFDNRLRVYAIPDIEASAEAADAERALLYTYALFHSRGIGASASQSLAWRSRRGAGEEHEDDTSPIIVDAEAVRYSELDVGLEAGALLDMLLFYDRMYLATDNGLFSVDPFDALEPPRLLSTEMRIRHACYAASAGLGTIAASCGPKGLQLIIDDVGWTSRHSHIKKAAPVSVRAEVGYGSVVNHRSRSDFEFLAGTVTDTDDGRVLTDVKLARVAVSEGAEELVARDKSEIEFTIWDRSRLVVFRSGLVQSVGVIVDADSRRLGRTRILGTYGGAAARVISATRVGLSFALETDDAIVIMGTASVRRLETGPVVSLRAYPRSHRYRRLATATSAAGLWMIGIPE